MSYIDVKELSKNQIVLGIDISKNNRSENLKGIQKLNRDKNDTLNKFIKNVYLGFFRNKDKIRIVWKTEYILDNGIELWTAKNGNIEMSYSEFITR